MGRLDGWVKYDCGCLLGGHSSRSLRPDSDVDEAAECGGGNVRRSPDARPDRHLRHNHQREDVPARHHFHEGCLCAHSFTSSGGKILWRRWGSCRNSFQLTNLSLLPSWGILGKRFSRDSQSSLSIFQGSSSGIYLIFSLKRGRMEEGRGQGRGQGREREREREEGENIGKIEGFLMDSFALSSFSLLLPLSLSFASLLEILYSPSESSWMIIKLFVIAWILLRQHRPLND